MRDGGDAAADATPSGQSRCSGGRHCNARIAVSNVGAAPSLPDPSTLAGAPHDLHGAFDMTPFARLLGLALALARQRILGSLGDRRAAVPFQHLPRDAVDLRLGSHVALLMFREYTAGTSSAVVLRLALKIAEPAVSFPLWLGEIQSGRWQLTEVPLCCIARQLRRGVTRN